MVRDQPQSGTFTARLVTDTSTPCVLVAETLAQLRLCPIEILNGANVVPKDVVELVREIRKHDGGGSTALGMAHWMGPDEVRQHLEMRPVTPSDQVWIGPALIG